MIAELSEYLDSDFMYGIPGEFDQAQESAKRYLQKNGGRFETALAAKCQDGITIWETGTLVNLPIVDKEQQ